ncbi:hypothetical protein [Glutamicibacter uratoxydans]|uniref:hypothetical protein n=1 Tax=Glutamicibacter uratoxydans TaxID=43667 RepID=UPI001476F75F|nr:hypothetical protein [Glutamicibacter uratoxydans]
MSAVGSAEAAAVVELAPQAVSVAKARIPEAPARKRRRPTDEAVVEAGTGAFISGWLL